MEEYPISTAVRTRFAPSPTGFLHIGSLRTALYNFLLARKESGSFILRIEDTDQKRYVEGSVEQLIESLTWAGLSWDEGPHISAQDNDGRSRKSARYPGIVENGECGPYIQSERLDLYRASVDTLLKEKKAYYCFCDVRRLEAMREEQAAAKRPPMYDRHCLSFHDDDIKARLDSGSEYVVRLRVERGKTIVFTDAVRGKVSFSSDTIDDQVLMKSDGFPTYHLANVVDDHAMRVTHVVRGEEWLPSTPKHVLLYEAFGWDAPSFAHLPLLLNPDRSKLSKRQGDVSVTDYVDKGYVKEAIVNFVALLGWNPGNGSEQEIFSLEELIDAFDVSKVHKAGAVFDLKKLDWINSQYIKNMNADELLRASLPFLGRKEWFGSVPEKRKREEYLARVLEIERERIAKLSDIGEGTPFLFFEPEIEHAMLSWKGAGIEETKDSLRRSLDLLETVADEIWTREHLQNVLFEAAGDKRGDLLWPLRVALTGAQKSPSPFDVAWVLGKEESLSRVRSALDLLSRS